MTVVRACVLGVVVGGISFACSSAERDFSNHKASGGGGAGGAVVHPSGGGGQSSHAGTSIGAAAGMAGSDGGEAGSDGSEAGAGDGGNAGETGCGAGTDCSPCGSACSALPHVKAGVAVGCTSSGGCSVPIGVAACSPGYGNCAAAANDLDGCETLLNTVGNCGSCGNACVAPANATPSCSSSGVCSFTCKPGFVGTQCELPRFASLGASTSARGISANGKVVVGVLGKAPARWTVETGFQKLQALSEPVDQGEAVGVSANGSVVSGSAVLGSGVGAFRWNATEGLVLLGTGATSRANAVSANGTTIAGDMDGPESDPQKHAFRWTLGTGAKDLVSLGKNGTVNGMSADGTLLVGGYSSTYDAFLWTNLGITRISSGAALAVSADGLTVVGDAQGSAFRYNVTGPSVALSLGSLVGTDARGISADGKVIVGSSTQGPWIWDATNGVRMLVDLLNSLGANMTGWSSLTIANGGLSGDGLVIVGDGYPMEGYRAWIARL